MEKEKVGKTGGRNEEKGAARLCWKHGGGRNTLGAAQQQTRPRYRRRSKHGKKVAQVSRLEVEVVTATFKTTVKITLAG